MFQEERTTPEDTPQQHTSEQKIQANRENATKSTGPRTPECKATVSRNATKHNLCSRFLIFESDEEKEDFEQLLAEVNEDREPVGIIESKITRQIAVNLWKLELIEGWSLLSLNSGRKTVESILRVCNASAGLTVQSFPDDTDHGSSTGSTRWKNCSVGAKKATGKSTGRNGVTIHSKRILRNKPTKSH